MPKEGMEWGKSYAQGRHGMRQVSSLSSDEVGLMSYAQGRHGMRQVICPRKAWNEASHMPKEGMEWGKSVLHYNYHSTELLWNILFTDPRIKMIINFKFTLERVCLPPVSGSGHRQPVSGSGHRQPVSGSGHRQPVSGSGHRQPVSGSGHRQPMRGQGT